MTLGGVQKATESLELAVLTASRPSEILAAQVAELTRIAYVDSDPLPGLPPPDGASEDAAGVAAFADRGGRVWVARDAAGEVAGALRTGRCDDGALFVSRVAVAPAWRKAGVGRWLLAAVEAGAAAGDEPVIRLDAVVERCVPPYYARLGYRVTEHHLAQDDKLLTEVAMERDPRAPRREQQPFPLTRIDPQVTGTLTWLLLPDGLAAVPRAGAHSVATAVRHALRVLDDPAARLAGVDIWRGRAGDLGGLLTSCLGAAVSRGLGPRSAVPLHRCPRAVHRDLWAALRPFPGAEPFAGLIAEDPEA